MRKRSLLLPLGTLALILTIACSSKPPVVRSQTSYPSYSQTRYGPNGISYSAPGDFDPTTGARLPYGAAGTRTAAVRPSYNPNGDYYLPQNRRSVFPPQRFPAAVGVSDYRPPSSGGTKSASRLYSEVRVKKDFLPYGARGRSRRSMRPTYITIHSTQNWSRGADALRHSLALKRSKLGRLSWHYTTDDTRTVQHLPTTEQGNHADHNGPGNRTSIGIEMCEHVGNSRERTMERTAKLAAWLMHKHRIPLSNVVPHHKWPRWGRKPPNKNCPHFLMTNGRPGAKWTAFKRRVQRHYETIRR